jgi:hypothetical protein
VGRRCITQKRELNYLNWVPVPLSDSRGSQQCQTTVIPAFSSTGIFPGSFLLRPTFAPFRILRFEPCFFKLGQRISRYFVPPETESVGLALRLLSPILTFPSGSFPSRHCCPTFPDHPPVSPLRSAGGLPFRVCLLSLAW